MTVLTFFRLRLLVLFFAFFAGFAAAQDATSPMDEIVKSATDSGMQVIVINPTEPPPTKVRGFSQLSAYGASKYYFRLKSEVSNH